MGVLRPSECDQAFPKRCSFFLTNQDFKICDFIDHVALAFQIRRPDRDFEGIAMENCSNGAFRGGRTGDETEY